MPTIEEQVIDWKEKLARLVDDMKPSEAESLRLGRGLRSVGTPIARAVIERSRRMIATYQEMIIDAEKAIAARS